MANRDFDRLSIDKQVEFINSQLEKIPSKRKVCEKFGIPRSTIDYRFKNEGYEFDNYEKKYKKVIKVLIEESNTKENQEKKLTDTKTKKYEDNTKVLVEEEKNINDASEEIAAVTKVENYKSNELIFLHEIEKKKNDLLELLELKEKIKELIQRHDKNIISVEAVELKIDKDILKGDAVNRSVKMYGAVYQELQELYKMYPEFKKYDILSEAIHEFYLKYKKIK